MCVRMFRQHCGHFNKIDNNINLTALACKFHFILKKMSLLTEDAFILIDWAVEKDTARGTSLECSAAVTENNSNRFCQTTSPKVHRSPSSHRPPSQTQFRALTERLQERHSDTAANNLSAPSSFCICDVCVSTLASCLHGNTLCGLSSCKDCIVSFFFFLISTSSHC